MSVYAEWIDYMNGYRLFYRDKPERTLAWADSVKEAEKMVLEQLGEGLIVIEGD